MNITEINEHSQIQPYAENRCWMKIRGEKKGSERFCSAPAQGYWCSKGMNMRVKMFLCANHAKKMEVYGYSVRIAK